MSDTPNLIFSEWVFKQEPRVYYKVTAQTGLSQAIPSAPGDSLVTLEYAGETGFTRPKMPPVEILPKLCTIPVSVLLTRFERFQPVNMADDNGADPQQPKE